MTISLSPDADANDWLRELEEAERRLMSASEGVLPLLWEPYEGHPEAGRCQVCGEDGVPRSDAVDAAARIGAKVVPTVGELDDLTAKISATEGQELGIVGPWTCALHLDHGTARPIRGCVHHVWPLGAGGPNVASNTVTVCETGHANVHAVMWALVNGRPAPKCALKELSLARRGVAAWVAAGKPGSLVAFMA